MNLSRKIKDGAPTGEDNRQHPLQGQDLFFVGPRLAVTIFGFLILWREVGRHKALQSRATLDGLGMNSTDATPPEFMLYYSKRKEDSREESNEGRFTT